MRQGRQEAGSGTAVHKELFTVQKRVLSWETHMSWVPSYRDILLFFRFVLFAFPFGTLRVVGRGFLELLDGVRSGVTVVWATMSGRLIGGKLKSSLPFRGQTFRDRMCIFAARVTGADTHEP